MSWSKRRFYLILCVCIEYTYKMCKCVFQSIRVGHEQIEWRYKLATMYGMMCNNVTLTLCNAYSCGFICWFFVHSNTYIHRGHVHVQKWKKKKKITHITVFRFENDNGYWIEPSTFTISRCQNTLKIKCCCFVQNKNS